ncbi:MAG: hypothetical protein WA240_14605 [Nitrospirota bacterium]
MQYLLRILRNRYLLFLVGILLIILFSRTWKINQNIANKSQGYFVLQNIEQANEAWKLGYIKYEINDYAKGFGIEWIWKPGMDRMRIIRSGPEDFDDVGYISLLQLIALAGKVITLTFVEKLHNFSFIISLIILSFIVVKLFRNILAGWVFLILALMLKSKILSLVYGSPDSRTFTIFFPVAMMSIIFGLNWLTDYMGKLKGMAVVLLFGGLIGMIALIRSSEGMAALYAILFCIAFLKAGAKQKAMSVVALIAGYFLITIILPIAFALHRDIKTGEFNGDISPYLQTTGKHQAWHSIVLGLGKYPNSIGMRYDDITCYDILRARYPDAMDATRNFHGKGYYHGLRGIFFDYITHHPFEYFANLTKTYAELFYFIPYATSAGNLTWWRYGYLPLKQGVAADDWDMPLRINPHGENLLVLKYRYLKLSTVEVVVFILAILVIILAVRYSFLTITEKRNKNIFLVIVFYMSLLATQRAIVPQHGLSFLVGFWILAIISLLYLCFTSNRIRSFLYWRVKIFNI